MIPSLLRQDILKELTFTSSRSAGPGGQNVNKVNSKITLKWDVLSSTLISSEERSVILTKLHAIITKEGMLYISSQEKRSQLENKHVAIEKLTKLLVKAFAVKKVRKPSKPSKTVVQKRIVQKKKLGEKKKWRQKGQPEG
jgi:ribosome-associated protein